MAKFILKNLLDKKGITQYRLAKMMGITPGEVYRYCQADYNPRLDTLIKIANALDVGLNALVDRSGRRGS